MSNYALLDVVADGSTNVFPVSFPYISKTHVHVLVDNVEITTFTWPTSGSVQLPNSAASYSGKKIRVRRITPVSAASATYVPGSLDASDLNASFLQLLYAAQEAVDVKAIIDAALRDGIPWLGVLADGGVTIPWAAISGRPTAISRTDVVPVTQAEVTGLVAALAAVNLSISNLSASLGSAALKTAGSAAGNVLLLDGSGNASDAKGDLRRVVPNAKTGAYVLLATDGGKGITITTGGVTVPSGVLAAGDVVSIYNDSASSQTITQGSGVTMYLVGTATTGNRTLALRGMATIFMKSPTECVIFGGGLS